MYRWRNSFLDSAILEFSYGVDERDRCGEVVTEDGKEHLRKHTITIASWLSTDVIQGGSFKYVHKSYMYTPNKSSRAGTFIEPARIDT